MSAQQIAEVTGGTLVVAAHNPRAILETAMDAFFASVQHQIGQKHGDVAGEWYANNDDKVEKLLLPYVQEEISAL